MTSFEGPVAVVGTGVIGAAWAALFLSRGHQVLAHDPAPDSECRLAAAITSAWPALARLGAEPAPPLDRLAWCPDLESAVAGAAFVQESGPEELALKQQLVADLDAEAPVDAVIASSASGLRPSDIQAHCRHPERVLVGHPFHPAHLIPLVEVVPGRLTSAKAVDAAMACYRAVGKRPVHVRQELAGHVANRLQAALWREAYSLVQQGVVSVAEVDAAIVNGPGLRWSAVGPFGGQHLSGGDGGIRRTLEHLGPPMVEWWDQLGVPEWSPDLIRRVVDQTEEEFASTTMESVAQARDRVLVELLRVRERETELPR